MLQSFQQMNRDTGQIEPLVLFSGDCFSPSILSSVTKGSHMVPVLNMMGVHAATIGNHDEDFGDDVAARLVDQTNFPWILSNVFDGMTGAQLAGTALTKMLEWYGIKIGILGLAEKEWIDTLPILPAHGRGYVFFLIRFSLFFSLSISYCTCTVHFSCSNSLCSCCGFVRTSPHARLLFFRSFNLFYCHPLPFRSCG